MVERSFAWAASHNKIRNNEVHGEPEAKLVLEDWFDTSTEKGHQTSMSASGTFEDQPMGLTSFIHAVSQGNHNH